MSTYREQAVKDVAQAIEVGGFPAGTNYAIAQRERVLELEAALRMMVASAHPHPTEHPTMTAAWKVAEKLLSDNRLQSMLYERG
jgi:uncharacterized protein YeaC (DUF1315 family)